MPADLTADAFALHEGTDFAAGADPTVDLRLVRVDRGPFQPGAPRAEPFSLLFVGPPDGPLDQRIHRLRHPEMGELEIFLVPLGPGPEGPARYEAVFN